MHRDNHCPEPSAFGVEGEETAPGNASALFQCQCPRIRDAFISESRRPRIFDSCTDLYRLLTATSDQTHLESKRKDIQQETVTEVDAA